MKLNLDSKELFKNHSFTPFQHGESIVQLGSCFSTNMSLWFRKAGFEVCDNPFGVIFHPLVIADHLKLALNQGSIKPIIKRDDIWLSYDAGSKIYGLSESEISAEIQMQIRELQQRLKDSKHLILTFGTAHGYVHNESKVVVANCHQQPGTSFSKNLFTSDELFEVWHPLLIDLKKAFPALKITFTLSPVRYIRDGIIENNQSKAVLIELIRRLQESNSEIFYFPSYELVIDVLRDYRFYEKDFVHPNEFAIDGVWDLIFENCFSSETQAIITELLALRQMEAHHLLFPESEKSAQFLENFHKKRERFLSQFVVVVW